MERRGYRVSSYTDRRETLVSSCISVAQLRRRISRIFCTHAPRNLLQIRLSSLANNDGVAENESTNL